MALGALWNDFFGFIFDCFFTTFCSHDSEGLRAHFWRPRASILEGSGIIFRDFGPLGRRNAGTDFELKTQAAQF